MLHIYRRITYIFYICNSAIYISLARFGLFIRITLYTPESYKRCSGLRGSPRRPGGGWTKFVLIILKKYVNNKQITHFSIYGCLLDCILRGGGGLVVFRDQGCFAKGF